MNSKGFALIVLALLLLAGTAQIIYYYPQFPERIATHFDAHGQANGWMTKNEGLLFHAGLLAFMAVFSLGIAFGISWIPTGAINLPHRDFWLAPERRAETLDRFSTRFLWFGCMTTALVLATMQFVMRANQSERFALSNGFWLATAIYGLGVIAWLVGLFRSFPNPHSGGPGLTRRFRVH